MENEERELEQAVSQSDVAAVDSLMDDIGLEDQAQENGQIETQRQQAPAPKANEVGKTAVATPAPGSVETGTETTTEPAEGHAAQRPAALASANPSAQDPEAFNAPKNLSPKGTANWNSLRGVAAHWKKQSEELQKQVDPLTKQIAELKQRPAADPALAGQIKTLTEELASYKRIYETENDPAFKAKYDTAITKNVEQVYTLMKAYGMDEAGIEAVKKIGGPTRMANLEERILEPLRNIAAPHTMQGRADARRIENLVLDSLNLEQERSQALEAIPGNREAFNKAHQERVTKQYQEYEGRFVQRYVDITKGVPYAQLQEVPANAKPEEKAAIEKSNVLFRKLQPIFQAAKYPATPEARADTAATVCLAFVLQEELEEHQAYIKEQDKRIAELEAKLGGIKKAGQTFNKGGGAPRVQIKPQLSDRLAMKSEEAIEAGMEEAGL